MGRLVGPFTIQSKLGAGGMGEVYRAHDSKLGRDVAIKMLPAAWVLDPDRRARFDREARSLAALNHPHIGAIYGVEDVDDRRALILELVEGRRSPNGSRPAPSRSKKRSRSPSRSPMPSMRLIRPASCIGI
jgi:serine/threonine protein kinase